MARLLQIFIALTLKQVIMVLRNVGNVLAIVILMVNVPKLEFSTREVVRMKTVLDWNDDN